MKTKTIVLTILGNLLACGSLFAQTTITMEGNVVVADDPATTSTVEGNLNVARYLVIGSSVEMYDPLGSISLAGGSPQGRGSIAIGFASLTSGDRSFASGIYSSAGYSSIAYGNESCAVNSSFAFGAFAGAAENSACIGYFSYAGIRSVALGEQVQAYGNDSVILGCSSSSEGTFSLTLGHYLSSGCYAQTTIGGYNQIIHADSYQWVSTDPLFVIANGFEDSSTHVITRSNALVMLKNGNTTLNGEMTAKKFIVTEVDSDVSMGEFGITQTQN